MSGWCCRASCSAWRPSSASPMISKSGSASNTIRIPARIRRWSSAMRTLSLRAAGEPERFVAVTGRLGRVGPAVEDRAQQVWRALLGELPRLLQRPPRGRPVSRQTQLTDEQEHAHLRVDLIDLAREPERLLR